MRYYNPNTNGWYKYVKCRVTGFEGRVVGFQEYPDGDGLALVQPKCTETDSLPNSEWISVVRLDLYQQGDKTVGFIK